MENLSTRQLKKQVHELLGHPDASTCITGILGLPLRRVVNPLFSFLYSLDESIKWRTVTAMGAVVSEMATREMEPARIVMRRFIWNLNDESGGIGWGSPEAMGEIMARSRQLADEFACLLVSYVRPDMNYLEHEELQKGVVWGLGRLAHARPGLVDDAAPFLAPYLLAGDPVLRGLAAWAAGALPIEHLRKHLEALTRDNSRFLLYRDTVLGQVCIGELAACCLQRQPL